MKENITNHSLGAIICAGTLLMTGIGASAQNLFVATSGAGNVNEYTPSGGFTPFATGLNYPIGLAFDSSGNLFVGDNANNAFSGSTEFGNIVEIAPNGSQSPFYGGVDPSALAFNSGNLFESDYHSGNIYEYNSAGVQSTFATGFNLPLALAFDSSGNLYVGSGYGNGNGIITEISGGTTTVIATGLSFPSGIAFDKNGNMYVGNNSTGAIYEYSGGVQTTIATLPGVAGLAINNAGDLFASTAGGPDTINIEEIAPGGTPITFVTMTGTTADLVFSVPEPGTTALAGLAGLASLVAVRRNRKA